MFDWENAIALHAMQGNRASSRGLGEVSCVFSSCFLYDVDRGVVMEPMQGKLASSQFDFVYTEQF